MNSVPRKLTLGLILAVGAAACGDDVTVSEQVPPTPVVHSVTVSPSSATVAQGGSFQFGAAIEADAGVVRTVTWSAAGGTGITVSTSGLASASATATGTASVCAASDAVGFTDVKSCASLTVAAPSAAATVQIDAITVGCTPINVANPGFVACGLNTPVATNNVYGQIDVQVNVNRPPNSGITSVRLEVFNVVNGTTATTPEDTYTETLSGDIVAGEEQVAAQQTTANRITFSVQTANYSITNNVATVKHINGQKRLRVTLIGAGGTPLGTNATAETQLSFRNANGFHVTSTTNLNSGNNANSTCSATAAAACPIRSNAPATGLAWNGGTPLALLAVPVVYATGALHPNGFTGVVAANAGTTVGFGSAACDLSGLGARLLSATVATGGTSISGTLPYTNNAAALPATLNAYEMAPGCIFAAAGELPFGTGVDATGNPVLNFVLGGIFGANNTLNSPFGPVVPTLPTAPAIRLDNRGPAAIAGYATGTNAFGTADRCFGLWLNGLNIDNNAIGCGVPVAALQVGGLGPSVNLNPQASFVFGRTARQNGWVNANVAFNLVHANMAIADALVMAPATTSPDGAIAPTTTNATGLPLDAGVGGTITFVPRIGACTTIATCATQPVRTTVTGVAETNTGFALGAIVQTADVFGNTTNPPAVGGNFLLVNNPLNLAQPYVAAGVLNIGVDLTTPTVASRGQGGINTAGTTFTNNTIQLTAAANFDYQADDQVPTGLVSTSGILSVAPGSDLYVSMSRRDGATTQFFCPTAANYQPSSGACTTLLGWAAGGTTYLRGSGNIPTDPAAGGVRAYYAITVFTRDQAGNQTTAANQTAGARDFIFDNTPPSSFGASFTPTTFPANAAVTFSGSATEDLDVGRGAITIRFPSLNFATNATGGDFIRLPWSNKTTGLTNPVGYLAAGPSTLALQLTSVWTSAIRTLEVVDAGGAAAFLAANPVWAAGGAAGAILAPGTIIAMNGGAGYVQDGNLANGAGPTQYNWYTQSVSRVGLGQTLAAPAAVPANQATALNYGQLGLLGTNGPNGLPNAAGAFAYWTQVQGLGIAPGGIPNQFFNMGWALLNPAAGNVDLTGGPGNVTTNKAYTAIALGTNGPMQAPFLGGVKFYALDVRQPLNNDASGGLVAATYTPPAAVLAANGAGVSLVEICSATSIVNDQATNTWQYTCTFNPSTGGANSLLQLHDFFGFNLANSTNQQLAVINQGFWGSGQVWGLTPAAVAPFNEGWQGGAPLGFAAAAAMPVIAIGCSGTGACLATRVSANAGFNVTP